MYTAVWRSTGYPYPEVIEMLWDILVVLLIVCLIVFLVRHL